MGLHIDLKYRTVAYIIRMLYTPQPCFESSKLGKSGMYKAHPFFSDLKIFQIRVLKIEYSFSREGFKQIRCYN